MKIETLLGLALLVLSCVGAGVAAALNFVTIVKL
jgi:hypothetical protein